MVPFQVGDMVVCVNDDSYATTGKKIDSIIRGNVYTIRKIGPFNGEICVWLEGIQRIIAGMDIPFRARRFRPVKKTDISVFEKLLNKNPVLV